MNIHLIEFPHIKLSCQVHHTHKSRKEVEAMKIKKVFHRIFDISIGGQNACFVLILHLEEEKKSQPVCKGAPP